MFSKIAKMPGEFHAEYQTDLISKIPLWTTMITNDEALHLNVLLLKQNTELWSNLWVHIWRRRKEQLLITMNKPEMKK